MTQRLEDLGARIMIGHDADNVQDADVVVVSSAIGEENPEIKAALDWRIPVVPRAEMLGELMRFRHAIAVAGTHGKTTTTGMLAHVLRSAGLDPGFLVGGVMVNGNVSYAVGGGQRFVIEGDEYDTAFFDKSAKFLHYRPRYLVVTSVEFDHADIYENERAYRRSFERLLRIVPSAGLVVACAADKGVRHVLNDYALSDVQWYAPPAYVKRLQRGSGRAGVRLAGGLFSFERSGRRVEFDCPGRVDRIAL